MTSRMGLFWPAQALFVLALSAGPVLAQETGAQSLPTATQWLMDAAGTSGRRAITSVFKIWCPKTMALGTGFALDTGYIITNEHVVRQCGAADLVLISSTGAKVAVSSLVLDPYRDLAAMKTASATPGLRIEKNAALNVGVGLSTWGYPFGYDGPAPPWTIGYLSGYSLYRPDPPDPHKAGVKHLVISGAFNPGNSGGPLLLSTGAVAGVVVSKRLFSLPPFLASAIEVMGKNGTGVAFEGTDGTGKKITFVESQLVAELLKYYRDVSQVYIGEAIATGELIAFLDGEKIPWHSTEPPAAAKKE
jgi:hypothetical protein